MEKYKNSAKTLEEELVRDRKFWKQNQLWSLLLFGAVILFSLLGGSGVSVAPGSRELTMTMQDDSTAIVAYDSIATAELLENADYGTMEAGTDARAGKSGTWEHPQWGSYTLCVYGSCSSAVRITTESGCFVVNLPSEEETRQLYQLIQDHLAASR